MSEAGGMKSWSEGDRPRERMLRLGPGALSDSELLGIVLRTGVQKSTAVDLARGVLDRVGSLRGLARASMQDLTGVRGIGTVKAIELLASAELGRRMLSGSDDTRVIIRSPEDVAKLMIPSMRDLQVEAFVVLLLDARNGVKQRVELTRGTLTASIVHPREVFKAAIDHRAAAIIVVHNHPSGNPEPSSEDIEVTRQLVETGKVVGITVHDHLIIAGDRYTSLSERGVL
jgi:DNA repair protein RadC